MMDSPLTFGIPGIFSLFSLLTLAVYIGLIVLVVYFMVSAIRFFKHKTENDRELLRKLDEIISLKRQADKNL